MTSNCFSILPKLSIRSDIMTTINCSSNCIHQKDGKCSLDNVTMNSALITTDCIFYEEDRKKKKQN